MDKRVGLYYVHAQKVWVSYKNRFIKKEEKVNVLKSHSKNMPPFPLLPSLMHKFGIPVVTNELGWEERIGIVHGALRDWQCVYL